MNTWLTQALRLIGAGERAVLVTVARAEGSTPREAGAKMLVSASQQWDTIGGGHLEWRALDLARTMLRGQALDAACKVERMPLGPSLGQCCGGAATLVFELLAQADAEWLQALDTALRGRRACVRQRTVSDEQGRPVTSQVVLLDADAGNVLRTQGSHERAAPSAQPLSEAPAWPAQSLPARTSAHRASVPSAPETCVLASVDGRLVMAERLAPPGLHIVLFGAGHVGQAIVRVLSSLPCTISWVDERDAQFPAEIPAHVEIEATDTPEAVVAQAPAGSCFLVMTHCHALDQRLCQHIFKRDDFAYFGLIGSLTKRRKFERRLAERGVDPRRFAQMVCPIGIEGIHGKAPEVIAISVVAELLRVNEQRQAALQFPSTPAASVATQMSAFADELVYVH
ncbi:xanthine dehydrogenase accessory protein XdhC [Allopusillimonas ginsengisoli]|uniref:xanthine dehydrogenase accessory protein XdhC n=1 Tax=Allopusillimonas ginsengisoli TaxID=453575 RepID=UPI001021820B|nr:xanthine dehydrogenase accessory protein XdhC [Allopusillimonas ginsengisoli]TEA77001.1 xanthine dehydrogenase accessory protein XdhC [Allopusillimonas ginsengisoli]